MARFATGSDQRKLLGLRLKRIYQIATETRHLARFVVFGSFVTEKREPNDVDVFLIMDNQFDMAALGGEEAAIEDWQIKRDGTERGIVEIIAEAS